MKPRPGWARIDELQGHPCSWTTDHTWNTDMNPAAAPMASAVRPDICAALDHQVRQIHEHTPYTVPRQMVVSGEQKMPLPDARSRVM